MRAINLIMLLSFIVMVAAFFQRNSLPTLYQF